MGASIGRPATRRRVAWLLAAGVATAACAGSSSATGDAADGAVGAAPTTAAMTTTATSTTTTTVPATTTTSTTSTSTTTTSTTTTTTTVPVAPAIAPPAPPADPFFGATNAAFDRLAGANLGASLSVARGGEVVMERASGPLVGGGEATASTPMVVASVSKIMLSTAIARLDAAGVIEIDAPVPWGDMGLAPHPAWLDVTVRELLDHSAGMPVARAEWFRGGTTCAFFLPGLIDTPPTADRGRWRYSNGNYCALGLLVEQATGDVAVAAVNETVFAPLDLAGAHTTEGGLLPDDMRHPKNTDRLSRLGAAGTFVVSTHDLAIAFSHLSPIDLAVLRQPAVFVDQYGIGHTGTIEGAKSCLWVTEGGATVVAATISGDSVATGGAVCDSILPAVARDLGLPSARPDRWP